MRKKAYIFVGMLLLCCVCAFAQSKEEARYEINVKRFGFQYDDREALISSREFIRLDPTYYVGYLYEGAYKYEKASDFLGFKNCIPPLKKALELLEKEFSDKLTARYNSWVEFEPLRMIQTDYQFIVSRMMDAYSNLNHPDSVMLLLQHYKTWDLQRDDLGADNYMAWTIHRNRFYTKDKYDFLENSIDENDKKALAHLYSSLAATNAKAALNEQTFPAIYIEFDRLSTYHYLAIIHEYEQDMDSAMYYFQKMDGYSIFPYNNFALFSFVNGDISTADSFFGISRRKIPGDKRLRECEYFFSIIQVMCGNPIAVIKHLSEIVRESGSSSGWGWYNIALARGYAYNGQLDLAMQHLTKAKNFKEVHIGTTWGQSHYDLSIKFLQTLISKKQIAAQKFENKNYWRSLHSLGKILKFKTEFVTNQFVLLNQIATNPERERVFFNIFASECTVSFDEILEVMLDAFDNKYFVKFYNKMLARDKRVDIKKYIKYYLLSILIERGEKKEAFEMLDKIESIEYIDKEFDLLFLGRVYQLYASFSPQKEKRESYLLKLYNTYPQLIPYSGLQMKFRVDVRSDGKNTTEDLILTKLSNYNIAIVDQNDLSAPRAKIVFSNDGQTDILSFQVVSAEGRDLVLSTKISYNDVDVAVRKLAYGLFNMIEPVVAVSAITSPTKR